MGPTMAGPTDLHTVENNIYKLLLTTVIERIVIPSPPQPEIQSGSFTISRNAYARKTYEASSSVSRQNNHYKSPQHA